MSDQSRWWNDPALWARTVDHPQVRKTVPVELFACDGWEERGPVGLSWDEMRSLRDWLTTQLENRDV